MQNWIFYMVSYWTKVVAYSKRLIKEIMRYGFVSIPDNLLRHQIRSCHKSHSKCHVWIDYTLTYQMDPIVDYYCTCPAGKWIAGIYAQTACILYYTGCLKNVCARDSHMKRTAGRILTYVGIKWKSRSCDMFVWHLKIRLMIVLAHVMEQSGVTSSACTNIR